jgi:hypothetical protein
MNKVLVLVGVIFSIVGVGLLIGDYFAYSSTREFISKARPATGVVEELVLHNSGSSSSSGTYHPQVRFRDGQGQEILFEDDVGSNPPSNEVGESVEVLYDGSNPQHAHINSFFLLWFDVLIFSILGGVFTLVGFGLLSVPLFSKRKKEWLRRNGEPIVTEFQQVIRDTSIKVNSNSPYRILSQWKNPRTDMIHVFKSESIWYDPTQYVTQKEITVLIDPNNPEKHYMDISFLPKMSGRS